MTILEYAHCLSPLQLLGNLANYRVY